MRLTLDIPDNLRPDLLAHIVALLERLHDEPEFAAAINLDEQDEDSAIQQLFTPERLEHIAKSGAEIDVGQFLTADQVDEHFRLKRNERESVNQITESVRPPI